jgi:hypothetical protein
MPIWFRPYVWIPLMAVLYSVVPLCIWDFSPHVLTHSMPYFLVGGSDWGGGNVFAFTKLAYWISLVGGAVATCSLSVAAQTSTVPDTFRFIFRNYGWHCLAAVILVLVWKLQSSTDVGDLWSLTAYLFAGAGLIVWTARELERRGRQAWRMILCVVIGTLWGLVPIGRG